MADLEKFSSMLENIFALSAVCEIPEIEKQRLELIDKLWEEFPRECKMMGLTDEVAA